MSRRRKKYRGNTDAVELNLAAMLDMAFQLLTFFILTFKPAPVEGQLSLRLPPPEPVAVARSSEQAGNDEDSTNPVAGIESLIISVFASPNGQLDSMAVGETAVGNLKALGARLETILGEEGTPFEQVVIQVSPNLRYQDLMEVVNVCAEQRLANGQPLTKLSFVELPGAAP
jgi:biopolymer transport protein ExbD